MNRYFYVIVINIFFIALSLFILSQKDVEQSPTKNLSKIAITSPVTSNFAKIIAGDDIEIISIIPAGIEPHEYEPTPKDISRLLDTDVIIAIGAGFEPWLASFEQAHPNKKIVIAIDEITKDPELKQFLIPNDPHIWLNPVLAQKLAIIIKDELDKLDGNKLSYQQNLNKLLSDLDKLDMKYESVLSECRERRYISSHGAFRYLLDSSNIMGFYLTGVNAEEEISSDKIKTIIDEVKKEPIKAIFVEPLVVSVLAQNLAKDINSNIFELDPLEIRANTTSDNYYFSTMNKNLTIISEALLCESPYAINK